MADRREIELVGPLHELGDAGHVKIVEPLEDRLHLEAGEILADVRKPRLLVLALDVGPVEVGASPVLLAELNRLEQIQGFEIRHEVGRILWHLRHTNLRYELAYEIALERGVVDERDRVEPD